METRVIRKNQGMSDVELSISVLKSAEGKTVGSVGIIKDITMLKKTEKELIESEERYRTIFENSAVAIMMTDENEQIISWNNFTEVLLGMGKEDLYLKPVESLYPSEEWKKIRAENIRQKGLQHHLETKMFKKNNESIDVNLSISVLKNPEGKVVGSIGVIEDITESKQMRGALEVSEENFRQLYEKAPIPYHTLSLTGIITNVNERWCQVLGYTKEEVLGGTIFDFVAVNEREATKVSFEKKTQRKKAYTGGHEGTFVTKGGEKRIFVIHDFFSFDKDKNVASVQTTMENITERKKAEERIKLFSDAVSAAYDSIILTDLNGNVTYANKSTLKSFGYTRQEIMGLHISQFTPYSETAEKILMEVTQNGNWRGELIGAKKNKEKIPVLASISHIKDEKGKPMGTMVIFRDITERKKAEGKLREKMSELEKAHNLLRTMNEELETKVKERTAQVEQLLEQKDEFINQLGHDLKTPLTPLMTLLPVLKECVDDAESKEIIDTVLRSADQMKNLVLKTLQLAKLSSSKVEFDIHDINLLSEVNEIIGNNQYFFDENDVKVENMIDNKIIVKVDKLQLNEILTNIFTNAVKYSSNSKDCRIIIDAQTEKNGDVTISVKDNGIGIIEEEINHIFDEFYKADSSRHDLDSSGLGLPICKRIVEKHGGKIWVESPGKGKGSTFYFTLNAWR